MQTSLGRALGLKGNTAYTVSVDPGPTPVSSAAVCALWRVRLALGRSLPPAGGSQHRQ